MGFLGLLLSFEGPWTEEEALILRAGTWHWEGRKRRR